MANHFYDLFMILNLLSVIIILTYLRAYLSE